MPVPRLARSQSHGPADQLMPPKVPVRALTGQAGLSKLTTVVVDDAEVMVILAVADLLVSAWLVAVTENVPAVAPAMYVPEVLIVPPVADQFTPVLLLPVTVAVNECDCPGFRLKDVGLMVIDTPGTRVTAAEANFELSAADVAVTVTVCCEVTEAGAL